MPWNQPTNPSSPAVTDQNIYSVTRCSILCACCVNSVQNMPSSNLPINAPQLESSIVSQAETNMNPIQGVSQANQSTATKERCTVWEGIIEYHEMSMPANQSQAQRVSDSLPCTVSSILTNGDPDVNADKWPNRLMLQLIPRQLIVVANLFNIFKTQARHVLIHFPQESEALSKLCEIMSSGLVGCIQFPQNCDIRIMVVLYMPDKKVYMGFIANDQDSFFHNVRQMYENHRKQQQKQREQTSTSSIIERNETEPQSSFITPQSSTQNFPAEVVDDEDPQASNHESQLLNPLDNISDETSFQNHQIDRVEVKLELGDHVVTREKETEEGFTHDWTVFVRGAEGHNIHFFVEKVVFHLHESFPNPKRVIKEPPYSVSESGYAGFIMPIDVYFRTREEPKKVTFEYDLCIRLESPPVSNIRIEKVTFQNPSHDFRQKLIKARGEIEETEVSQVDSSINGESSNADATERPPKRPRVANLHTTSSARTEIIEEAKLQIEYERKRNEREEREHELRIQLLRKKIEVQNKILEILRMNPENLSFNF